MMIPDIHGKAPRLGISQLSVRGLPVIGSSGGPAKPMSLAQMRSLKTVARPGYGNFDTALPDQRHCGRTLLEIYGWAASNFVRILSHNETWIQDSVHGPRVLVFVRWVEYTDRDTEAIADLTN